MIHFIVATNFEARPLIDFFKLKKKIHIEEFQIFNNEEISLTVSGIGKIFSALAVAHTYFQFGKKKNQIWINFGLAGHKNLKIGKLVLVNKIIDSNSNFTFFPFFHKKFNFEKKNCTTYDRPDTNYNDSLSDMEASGFFGAASKHSTTEFIHSFKIISDNQNESINFRDEKKIYRIISKQMKNINSLVKEVNLLKKKYFSEIPHIDQEISKIFEKVNFTFSEKEQFKKIFRLHLLENPKLESNLIDFSCDAKTNIKKLRQYLKI